MSLNPLLLTVLGIQLISRYQWVMGNYYCSLRYSTFLWQLCLLMFWLSVANYRAQISLYILFSYTKRSSYYCPTNTCLLHIYVYLKYVTWTVKAENFLTKLEQSLSLNSCKNKISLRNYLWILLSVIRCVPVAYWNETF